MIRALGILAAVAALAVSAAPVASASSSKTPPPQVVVLIGANDYGLVPKPPPRGTGNAMFFPWDMASKARPKPRGTQLTTGISDGTSNTMMWGGSLKSPNGIIAILIG